MSDIDGFSPASLPADFVWGTATSSYQIEGAVTEDGRTPSIWDTFVATPGRIRGGDTADVAVDHFHRWPEDLQIMRDLGVDAYRFSVSWPRIQPHGRGPANQRGLDFYDRLVDGVLEQGISPWLTLYHWDLPQALEDDGGWPSRDTAARFADFTQIVAESLGDRVKHWISLNEPWCAAYLGYASGIHAPGRTDGGAAVAAAHHLLLGHGLAVDRIRDAVPDAQVGITLNLYSVSPLDDSGRHDDAVRRIDGLMNRWFLDSILTGNYPADVVADVAHLSEPDLVRDGDLAVISRPLDFVGVNYYTRHIVGSGQWPGSSDVRFVLDSPLPKTQSGWDIDPAGFGEVLQMVHEIAPHLPIYVTENGAAFPDELVDGEVDDQPRIDFLSAHLAELVAARERGVDVRGYFAWSLLDNFEWAEGNLHRFGLVHVDYDTQVRTPKASAHWISAMIRAHREAEGSR